MVPSPSITGTSGSCWRSAAHLSLSYSSTATWAASFRNASTVARPIPEPAPTINARLPASQPVIHRRPESTERLRVPTIAAKVAGFCQVNASISKASSDTHRPDFGA